MKKWLYPAAVLAAAALLSRLPHPARDIADLKPVRAMYLHMEGAILHVEVDTGDTGSGFGLTEAYEALKARADGEIFLDTAEFLLLDPRVSVGEDFYTLLRPDCKVAYAVTAPDLETVSDYLTIHPPKLTLAKLRMQHSA